MLPPIPKHWGSWHADFVGLQFGLAPLPFWNPQAVSWCLADPKLGVGCWLSLVAPTVTLQTLMSWRLKRQHLPLFPSAESFYLFPLIRHLRSGSLILVCGSHFYSVPLSDTGSPVEVLDAMIYFWTLFFTETKHKCRKAHVILILKCAIFIMK